MASISITIPKKVASGEEFVAVPRKEYEGLLRFYRIQKTKKHKAAKKKDGKLTKGLREALDDVKAGRISKAFDNAEDLVADILSRS